VFKSISKPATGRNYPYESGEFRAIATMMRDMVAELDSGDPSQRAWARQRLRSLAEQTTTTLRKYNYPTHSG
jgi:hypothetical protein